MSRIGSAAIAATLEFITSRPVPPSLREIATHFGIDLGSARHNVLALSRAGALRYTRYSATPIEVLP